MITRSSLFLLLLFLSAPPLFSQQRIITAGSSSTEIVCALGYCDKIIATDRTSLYPEKMKSLPSIGYRTGINAEGVISLQPDLVIFEKEYVKEEVISHIRSAGIKIIVVAHEQNFESTQSRIRAIAVELDKRSEAETLIGQITSDLSALQKKVNLSTERPTVLCVYNRGAGNMQVAGKNTSFGLLLLAGAVNVVEDVEGYKPLNTESLIQENPDYILFFQTGLESIGGIEGALTIPGVAQTTAGKKRQIIAMDGILLTNWGPRLAYAAGQLFYLTHPKARK